MAAVSKLRLLRVNSLLHAETTLQVGLGHGLVIEEYLVELFALMLHLFLLFDRALAVTSTN